MKSSIARITVVALVAFALVVPSAVAAERRGPRGGAAAVERVKMVNGDRFRPATLTISRGTRVRWVNRDNVLHTTTSNTGIWDATVQPGERFTRRFRRAGEFDYRCTVHPRMVGTIVVT